MYLNGERVTTPGTTADAQRDEITVDGRKVQAAALKYVALYKPRGAASTRKDPHAKHTVMDLLPAKYQHLFPVGRLDVPSEGLMLFTNDGSLAHRISHPRYGIKKVYRVTVTPAVKPGDLEILQGGLVLEDGPAKPVHIRMMSDTPEKDRSRVEIGVAEGRNRLIRRMFEAIGRDALRLVRVSIGPIEIGKLKPGDVRELTDSEVGKLKKATTPPAEQPRRKKGAGKSRQTRRRS